MLFLEKGSLKYLKSRCMQCGVCLSACPHNALLAVKDCDSYCIKIDESACAGCGKCIRCCPATIANKSTTPRQEVLASASGFIASSIHDSTRKMASSGGVCRTLIARALASDEYDAVYTLVYSAVDTNGRPLAEAEGQWLTEPVPQERIPGSLYRPVLWGGHLSQVNPEWTNLLIIGLPCQIRAAKKMLETTSSSVRLMTVTILCRKQKSFGHSQYLLRYFREDEDRLHSVFYRGNGWPGTSGVWNENGKNEIPSFYYAKCWNLPGCDYCTDCLNAEITDLTVADPWGIVAPEENPLGSNLVVAWTKAGNGLLESVREFLAVQSISKEDLVNSLDFNQIKAKANFQSLSQWYRVYIRIQRRVGEIILQYCHHDSPLLTIQFILKGKIKSALSRLKGVRV